MIKIFIPIENSTIFSTNITIFSIFAFFNPTAENLGGDKSSRLLNGTFSADQMRPVKNYGCGLEFITLPQISHIPFFIYPPFTISSVAKSVPKDMTEQPTFHYLD